MMLPVPVNGKLPFVSERRRVRTSSGSGASRVPQRSPNKHSAPLEPPPLNSASLHYYARTILPMPRSAPIPIRPNRLSATAPAHSSSARHSSTRKSNTGSGKSKPRLSSPEEKQKVAAAGAIPSGSFLSEPTLQHAAASSPSKASGARSGNQLIRFFRDLFGRRRREVELHSPSNALADGQSNSAGSSPSGTLERSNAAPSPKSSLNSVKSTSTSSSNNNSSTTSSSASVPISARNVRRSRSFTETDHNANRFWASPSDPIVVHKREPVVIRPKGASPRAEERSGAVTLLIRAENLGAIQLLNNVDEVPLGLLPDPIYVLDESGQVEYLVCNGRRRYFSTSPTPERLVPIAEEDEDDSAEAELELDPEQVTRETSFSETATELDAEFDEAPASPELDAESHHSSTRTSESSGTGTGANSPANGPSRAESPAPPAATTAVEPLCVL